ncbi:MAG: copper chaperone PCu(A)C [Acidimicrobiales bacterium]
MNGSSTNRSRATGSKLMAGFAIAALAAGGLAACGDDDEGSGAAIDVSGAWARTSPAGAEAGAAYMTVTSADGATIVGVSVDPDVAGVAELHEVVPAEGAMDDMAEDEMDGEAEMAEDEMAEDEMADGEMADGEMADGEMDHDGMDGEMAMTMQQVPSVEVPAGGTVVFEPGGYHVMLLELPDPLETGEEFDVTLTLDDDTEIVVAVTVSENAPE